MEGNASEKNEDMEYSGTIRMILIMYLWILGSV